jgi:predicted NAD/FAD-binding protein
MSFSVTRDKGAFEWGGEDVGSLFCQISNLFSSSMWRMIWDVLRFNASARRLLAESESAVLDSKTVDAKEISVGAYLKANGYSDAFRDDYLLVSTINLLIIVLALFFIEANGYFDLVDSSK